MSRPQVIDDEEHERVHDRVAAVDVAKDAGVVCTRTPHPSRPGARRSTVRTVRARMKTIRTLGRQLKKDGIEVVTLKAPALVYWWPVYHALAQAGIEVCVCNAAHMRNVPGRKRDITDCQWIAELHEYGLLRASFIPAAEVAALRQRTGYRKKLIGQRASEGQRLAKVLEDAGIKTGLGGVAAARRVGPGDDRGADRRGAQPRAAGGPGQRRAAPQDR